MKYKELIPKIDIEGIIADYSSKELARLRKKEKDLEQKVSKLEKKLDKNPSPRKRKLRGKLAGLGLVALLSFGGCFYRPILAVMHNNKGVKLHCVRKLYDEAEIQYKKAIELYPNLSDTHNNLGLLYYEQKKYLEAEAEYKKAMEINPKHKGAHFNLGILYKELKQYKKAEESLKKSIELDPDYVPVYRSLGGLYKLTGRNDEAEIQFRIAQGLKK